MNPRMMDLLKKRFGGKGPTSFAPDSLPELDYATEMPDGGSVQVTRKPLPIEDEEQPDSITSDLAGQLTDEERAGLGDPRASAGQQDMRGSFDRMSNVFLNAGGLAPLTPRKDPYAGERDEMRDWVMKRGGVAQRQQAGELGAERTGAYLAATKSQQERAAAAQALQAEREGRMADAEKFRQEQARLESERKKLESERDQANKDREFGLKEKAEAKKKDKSKVGPKGAPKGFPAGWELEGNTTPTPKQGEQFETLVYSSEKMRGLTGQMKKLLGEAGASGRALPGPMQTRLKQLATEIMIEGKNVAELGALSGPDMGLMESIAADPTKAGSLLKDMPALLDGLGSWADNSVTAKAKSLGARRTGSSAAVTPTGPVKMKFPDGSVHDVAPDKMELAKRKGAVPNG